MNTPLRILLADDHAVVRAGIRQFLEQANNITVVAEAEDGQAAQALISKYQPDVAVLDIQMPHVSGIEVTRWVQKTHPRVGVLVLTAYDDDPYIMAVLNAGANGFVLKTADPRQIIQAVYDVHDGKSVLDPKIAHKIMRQMTQYGTPIQPDTVTSREQEVLALTAKGFTNKAIGVQLGISSRTVQGHLAKIYDKLDCASRTEAVMKGVALGLIEAEITS